MEPKVEAFLRAAAAAAGTDQDSVLTRAFHLGGDHLDVLLPDLHHELRMLFAELDENIRVRNPGLHYVRRKTYVGYRREAIVDHERAERSQVFLSVLRNSRTLELVLPLNPTLHEHLRPVRNLTGQGHHGIGELQFTVSTAADLETFMTTFDTWLRPPK